MAASSPKAPVTPSTPLPLPAPLWEHHFLTLKPILEQALDQRKIHPVMLLTGPRGIGKRDVAYALAQIFLCEKPDRPEAPLPIQACGSCVSCKKGLAGHWVDFMEIAPESNDEGKAGALKIDQFKELKSSQGFGAYEGKYRIILIRDVETMTPQAANSLLKFLEEPPQRWLIFMTANDVSLVLPTIVSRSQHVPLQPISEESLFEILTDTQGVSAEIARTASRLADGSLATAQGYLDPERMTRRKEFFALLRNPREHVTAWVDWGSQHAQHLPLMMDWIERVLLDLQEWALSDAFSADPRAFAWKRNPEAHELGALADLLRKRDSKPGLLLRRLERALEPLLRYRTKLQAPLNRKMVVQEVLAPWLEP